MTKKIVTLLFLLVLAGGIYGGLYVYRSLQNTPERTAERFVQQLAEGKTDQAFAMMAPDLTSGRETYWRDFLKQFKQDGGQARLVAHEQLKDSFNAYPENAGPERFTYALKRAGQDSQLTLVLLKTDKSWTVAELSSQML